MRTKGWQKVFSFTLIQYIKTKSFIIGTIVVCLIVALISCGVNIIPALLSSEETVPSDSTDGTVAAFSAVYITDDAGILTEEDSAALTAAGAKLEQTELSFSELTEKLKNAEDSRALVTITENKTTDGEVVGYTVKTYYSPESDGGSVDALSTSVSGLVNYRNMMNSGVSPDKFAQSQRYVSSTKIEAGSSELGIFEGLINYLVPMVVSLVLFILIFAYGQTVAQSIATEKTSRVMELLLTSVRPLAVVIGKVIAMGIVSFGQFLLIGIVGTASFLISAPFGIGGQVMNMMNDPELAQMALGGSEQAEIAQAVSSSFGSVNPFTIILIIIIFLLGFLFFSLIAALVGASISRMEDLQQAMQPYALLGLLGLYLAYFPVIFNAESLESGVEASNPVQIFSYYFPISSPFSLPSALLLGNLDMVQSVIAVLILAAFVVLIAIVVGKVYEGIILHNGSRIKLGDIFKMALRK